MEQKWFVLPRERDLVEGSLISWFVVDAEGDVNEPPFSVGSILVDQQEAHLV
jgi:hypothetical protein